MNGEIVGRTVEAICHQIEHSAWKGRPAKTVFFGGGTPTFLSAAQLSAILGAVTRTHPVDSTTEVTSEANPGTVDAEKLSAIRSAGFNRISIGAQSFDRQDLVRLGRVHDDVAVGQAFHAARRAGFQNINLDLIFGLPGQSVKAWLRNLELAISLSPDHLSLYGLTIEPNTRFYRYDRRGMLNLPNEDDQVQMYDVALSMAKAAGYQQYEISNFCREGAECQHNLAYWHGEEYLAYGPGAVGCIADHAGGRLRFTNLKHPERYCDAIEAGADPWVERELLDLQTQHVERVMLGLRLSTGIPRSWIDDGALQKVIDRGWLARNGETVALTPSGRHACSEVTALLI